MADIVKCVAALCAPAMAAVGWITDSADDRRERARQRQLNRLWHANESPSRLPQQRTKIQLNETR